MKGTPQRVYKIDEWRTGRYHACPKSPHTTLFVAAVGSLLVAGGIMSGCIETPIRTTTALPGYSFDYQLQNREPTGLIQVFDDGSQTYLQFADWTREAPTIVDGNGTPVAFERLGTYARIAGRYDRLLVRAQGAQTIVNADSGPRDAAGSATLAPHPEGTPAAVQAKEVEVSGLHERVATLEAQLAEARAALLSYADKLVIHFGNNSAKIPVDRETVEAIAEVVRDRDAIVVTGYTDATYPDAAGEALARRRAQNVRTALAGEGIPASHVQIAFHAAGMFAVGNYSVEGKALNRRVEIVSKTEAVIPPG